MSDEEHSNNITATANEPAAENYSAPQGAVGVEPVFTTPEITAMPISVPEMPQLSADPAHAFPAPAATSQPYDPSVDYQATATPQQAYEPVPEPQATVAPEQTAQVEHAAAPQQAYEPVPEQLAAVAQSQSYEPVQDYHAAVQQPAYDPAPAVHNGDPAADVFDISVIESEHAHWLSSEGKEGKRANFRGLDLSGMDLSGRHLMEASFRGASLAGANLSSADLRAADLSEAILDKANLSGAYMYGASLARAQMHQTQASGADMTTANLAAVVADGINLNAAKLGGAILRDANLRQADLTNAVLRDANMRGATLVEAKLIGADLSSADCRDANFDRGVFAGAILEKTNFRGAKLGEVDVHAPNFQTALDVAAEFQSQSLQSERGKLEEEQAQLATRERTLAQEKERINSQLASMVADMQANHEALAVKLRKLSLGFTIRFVFWLLIVLAVVAMVVNRMDDIDFTNPAFIAVFSGVLIVFLLALLSMFRSIQIAGIVKKYAAEKPVAVDTAQDKPAAAASAVSAEPSLSSSSAPSVSPKKSGFGGFGKKNK